MNIFLYLYSLLFILAISVPITLSVVCYYSSHNPLYLSVGLLFLLFLIDEVVITLTELVPSFAAGYDATFMIVPTYKTLLYAATFICIVYFFTNLCKAPMQYLLIALLVVLIVFLMVVPMMQNNAFKSWVYYFPNQLYSFIFALYWLKYVRTHKEDLPLPETMQKKIRTMLKTLAVFSVLIAIEDTIVIFFFDNYTASGLDINNRNHFEDLLRLVLSVQAVIILYQQLRGLIPLSTDSTDERPKNEISGNDLKFHNFCTQYYLTGREREILHLILQGKTTAEISEQLMLSEGTIKTHTHNIYTKLSVSKKQQVRQLYENYQA